MKRKSTDISSYFKKKITAGGEKEMTGEQHRFSEDKEEDEGEEQTEQDDKDTQPVLVKHSEEEHQTAADQGQSAPLVTEVWQNSAKADVRRVPGPTGEVTTMWP
ncbi:hypothetical protein GOODEAATRI_033990 [Goodea atripinnis]|uniref:Natural killer-tumor recognition protein n=1 Tax=Goodea atripinnis TaxID=208336 RepID=A0ABV0P003_9TELE